MNDQPALTALPETPLTRSELQALQEVTRGRLMQKKIPDADRDRLIEAGYVEHKLGGLQATSEGHRYAAAHRS